MYLALIPDEKSKKQIKSAIPACADLHLTIIHCPEKDVTPPIGFCEKWFKTIARESLSEQVLGIRRFGPANKQVWGLAFHFRRSMGPDIEGLRTYSESVLTEHNLSWSKQWGFTPHITLSRDSTLSMRDVLPEYVRFDRLEWR